LGRPPGFFSVFTISGGTALISAALATRLSPCRRWNDQGAPLKYGAGGLYTYLFAKYDGPNYGSEVWYVGDLSGIITIPSKAGGYGLSGWTLFGPGGPGVPDGGTTAMLLGVALSVLGVVRRYMMS
jgi:hypothetical protein